MVIQVLKLRRLGQHADRVGEGRLLKPLKPREL